MSEQTNNQVQVLKCMYDLHLMLLSMTEDELKIFCENNDRLIQNLKDALSY